jgi:hypothetical protein
LNLLLLVIAVAGLAYGRYHREKVASRFSRVLLEEQRTPTEVKKIKEQLAGMDLTREALSKELDGRLEFLQSLKSDDFYLSVDTQQRKLRFYYGDTVLREADVTIGANTTVKSPTGKTWTFIPVKGSFRVDGKVVDYPWQISEWVYVMNNEPVPDRRPVIEDGLGKYVIFLPNGYVIHSPPGEKSPLNGAKPGSFMVSEDDLRAIWPRLHIGTAVYIF